METHALFAWTRAPQTRVYETKTVFGLPESTGVDCDTLPTIHIPISVEEHSQSESGGFDWQC